MRRHRGNGDPEPFSFFSFFLTAACVSDGVFGGHLRLSGTSVQRPLSHFWFHFLPILECCAATAVKGHVGEKPKHPRWKLPAAPTHSLHRDNVSPPGSETPGGHILIQALIPRGVCLSDQCSCEAIDTLLAIPCFDRAAKGSSL